MDEHAMGTALVTGASSGIGAAFASRLAARGYDLILTARRKEALDQGARELESKFGISAEVVKADLAKSEDISLLEERIRDRVDLSLLVNNAGFGTTGHFDQVETGKQAAMLSVHVEAPTRLARAALPGMIERGRGGIINVASTSAFVLFPGNALYSATKRFLITLSQCLALELKGSGVSVQALCPGFTRSGFHESDEFSSGGSSIPEWLWMGSEEVAEASVSALGGRNVVMVPGFKNRLLYVWMRRFMESIARRKFK
jgi:short-subunit dehydrogenase